MERPIEAATRSADAAQHMRLTLLAEVADVFDCSHSVRVRKKRKPKTKMAKISNAINTMWRAKQKQMWTHHTGVVLLLLGWILRTLKGLRLILDSEEFLLDLVLVSAQKDTDFFCVCLF